MKNSNSLEMQNLQPITHIYIQVATDALYSCKAICVHVSKATLLIRHILLILTSGYREILKRGNHFHFLTMLVTTIVTVVLFSSTLSVTINLSTMQNNRWPQDSITDILAQLLFKTHVIIPKVFQTDGRLKPRSPEY